MLKKEKQKFIDDLFMSIKTIQILDQISQHLELAIQEIYYHPVIFSTLTDSSTPLTKKKEMLRKYFKERDINILTQKFFEMLLMTNNLQVINDQDKPTFLELLREKIRNIHPISIVIPDYVNDYVIGWIHTQLQEILDYPFVLDINVDPSQKAGIKIKTDEFAYEDTLKSRLQNMKNYIYETVHARTLQAIQELQPPPSPPPLANQA